MKNNRQFNSTLYLIDHSKNKNICALPEMQVCAIPRLWISLAFRGTYKCRTD